MPWLFDWRFFLENPDLNKTFDVALHVGTFAGGLAYFWRDILRYSRAFLRSVWRLRIEATDERLAWGLALATVPGAAVGALAEDFIEQELGQIWLIAAMLVVFGVLLWVVDRRAGQDRRMAELRIGEALLIGVAQAISLQPGVSRSGVTMTAGRALRLDRESAARFSFLLSLPIIAGAGLYKGLGLVGEGLPPGTVGPFVWGMIASALSGFLVIWGLLAYVRRRDFAPFVVYRLVLAGVVFGLIGAGVRSAAGV